MRPLIISEAVRENAAYLVAHARRNIVTEDELRKAIKTGNAIGDDAAHRIEIPVGFRVVFSLEQQPAGLCRHLSVSVSGKKYPHEAALKEIAALFGIDATKAMVWFEHHTRAVNLLQPDAP